jgi:pre-mRNA-splicing factor ATP-dependent RNA helicase DHX16
MASDKQLRDWVSDKLMSVQGYSTNVLANYVIGLGTRIFELWFLLLLRVQFFF